MLADSFLWPVSIPSIRELSTHVPAGRTLSLLLLTALLSLQDRHAGSGAILHYP